MIRIWKFTDAPQDLRDLYSEGSAETWVLEAPPGESAEAEILLVPRDEDIGKISRVQLPDGRLVVFGRMPGRHNSPST
jgi:hypothetical protein